MSNDLDRVKQAYMAIGEGLNAALVGMKGKLAAFGRDSRRPAYKWGPGVSPPAKRDLDDLPHESFIPPEMAAKMGRGTR